MLLFSINLGVESGGIISVPRAGRVGRRGQPGTLTIKLKVNISAFNLLLNTQFSRFSLKERK